MNVILLKRILLILFSILKFCPFIYSSTSCSIFPLLNCSCFQSSTDLNSDSLIKTYSHLYCQGNSLTEQIFQPPFGPDFSYQKHFRTVSIEFFSANRIEIQENQFDSLALLFSETNNNDQVNVILRFDGFSHITFHKNSLTSKIFQEKPQNKHLSIYLIPSRNNQTQIEFDEKNSTVIKDQFHFYSNCFSGLIVSQLIVYIHTLADHVPSLYSFENIFNNTNIGELHLHGSIIRPNSFLSKESFTGIIRSLTLHRHIGNIDAQNFPFYSNVYSYTIHSIEAYSMNLSSFLPSYKNLRGLEIIKPRFEVSIDQFIPTLDYLNIDVENLSEKTLLAARHIYHLKLGSSLRRIDPKIFTLLSQRLQHLDLSDINLSQMKSDSRCDLIEYLSKNYQKQINIILPRIENITDCDCTHLFIKHIQLRENLKKIYNFSITCSKLCYLNDCPIISEYFKKTYPLSIDENPFDSIDNETINDNINSNEYLSLFDVSSDSIDLQMMFFLVNQTNDQEEDLREKQLTTTLTTINSIDVFTDNISVIENIQEYDDTILSSTPKSFELWNIQSKEKDNELFHPNNKRSFSWFLLFIILIVILLLIILSLIVVLLRQYRRKHDFSHLPVYV